MPQICELFLCFLTFLIVSQNANSLMESDTFDYSNEIYIEAPEYEIFIDSPEYLYLTQEFDFTCGASSTIFNTGFKWYLNYADGQTEYLGLGDEILYPSLGMYIANKTVYINNLEISEIVCSGKLVINGEYLNTSSSIEVKVGTKPKIISKPPQIDPYKPFKVRCEAEGDPLPEFKWTFGKAEPLKPIDFPGKFVTSVADDTESEFEEANWTEFESLIPVGEEYDSFYLGCEVQNFLGRDELEYLNFTKPRTWPWPYILAGGLILVVFCSVIIALLIRKIRRSKKKIRFLLSKEEINEFQNGNEILAKENIDEPLKHIEYLPYNQNFEIPKDDICIEHDKILGEGAFGTVVHGFLKGRGQHEKVKGLFIRPQNSFEVAIKTTKPHSGPQYLKALLYEIKLLIFIKSNPNIVKFYGSITADLIKGRVYMVFEYCQNGSLLEFLRRNRNGFQNFPVPAERVVSGEQSELEHSETHRNRSSRYIQFPEEVREFSIVHLNKWALEISSGVDYLHKNKIIHSDLAARNILISDNLTAKITDFGLSRHLYEYLNYVKQTQEPLPWRSMALESLRDMTFSFKTDIWSYGVTLWELYSLGHTPYPGYNWSPEFIEELAEGMRMSKPEFANDQLYQIILDCWDSDPEKRPEISNFKNYYSQVLIIED